ncbi:sulfonate ABC transporter substrate-binding protein [Halobacteriales archaeon SW_12_71_31]|nr:MAG: sulfonate ABC transporter substrate-binding protein [Halobacteriales archaeon SW_12_71_31]
MDDAAAVSRRDVLRASAGLGAATSLAGCSGGGGPDTLRLGTLNVFPMMQYFVIEQQGWYDELEPDVEVSTFGGGPPLVQAYASGNLDFAYVGISPGVIAVANGVDSTVVAANVLEPNVMVGDERFRRYWSEHGADAFERFREDVGRKPRFATLPAGSTPDVFLRFWITERLGLDLDVVEIVGQSPSALRSTLSTGNADAGSAIEPIPSSLRADPDSDMEPFRYADAIMPGQPGAVLQPSADLVENDPGLVEQLVEIHVRATEFVNENRGRAAEMAAEVVGTDVLPTDTARRAVESPASTFISDPRRIVDKTLVYNDFHQQLGSVDRDLSEDDVFDHSFYRAVSGRLSGSRSRW